MTLFCCCIPYTHTLGMDHFTISIDMVSFLLNHFVLFILRPFSFCFRSLLFFFLSFQMLNTHLNFEFAGFSTWIIVGCEQHRAHTYTSIAMLCAQVRTYLSNKYRFFLWMHKTYQHGYGFIHWLFYATCSTHWFLLPYSFGYFVCTAQLMMATEHSPVHFEKLNQNFISRTSKQTIVSNNWIFLLDNVFYSLFWSGSNKLLTNFTIVK